MEPPNFSWAPENLLEEDFRKITRREGWIKKAVKATDRRYPWKSWKYKRNLNIRSMLKRISFLMKGTRNNKYTVRRSLDTKIKTHSWNKEMTEFVNSFFAYIFLMAISWDSKPNIPQQRANTREIIQNGASTKHSREESREGIAANCQKPMLIIWEGLRNSRMSARCHCHMNGKLLMCVVSTFTRLSGT